MKFSDGSTQTFLPGAVPPYFSTDPDGESLDGTAIPIAGTNPIPVSATLTGNFSPTGITLSGGRSATIFAPFTVTINKGAGNATLVDGDYGIVYATPTAPLTVPALSGWMMIVLAIGLGMFGARKVIQLA